MVIEAIREISSIEGRIYYATDFNSGPKSIKVRLLKQLSYDEMLPHNENYS